MIHPLSGIEVLSIGLAGDTRCLHYDSALDLIAIRFRCCGSYYACHLCHEELADHPAARWRREEFGEKAILCGACGSELTIDEYTGCMATCPRCGAAFNPRCALHYGLYFEMD